MEPYFSEVLWIVILGFVLAFILSFGVGANDVSNSFATSIGSGVLTFRQACYLASVFEVAGAILLGYKVTDTIRKGILEVDVYDGNESQLMQGMLATLAGAAIWLLIATYFKLPVSTTHSVVGATIGFGLVAHGTKGLSGKTLLMIAISWVVSPVLSGLISVAIFLLINRFILNAKTPFKTGLASLPYIYALTIFINVLSITFDGSKLLRMDNLPIWLVFTISVSTAIVVGILARIFVVPWQRNKILRMTKTPANMTEKPSALEYGFVSSVTTVNTVSTTSVNAPVVKDPIESEENVNQLFNFLQILAAIFSSFAHGGNDVSNAVGPLVAIWMIYVEGNVLQKSESPIWLLLYGGVGIVVGLWCFGERVIETVGKKITKITPATGFVIENGTAATVLIASKIAIPVSTTHCKIGSVVFVGWVYGRMNSTDKSQKNVDWSVFRNIAMSWLVTLPAAGGMSAIFMYILSLFT